MPTAVYQQPARNQRELTLLVNDYSGSMHSAYDGQLTKLDAVKKACINLILNKARIDAGDEIGIVVFNSSGRLLMPLAPIHIQKRQMIQTIEGMAPDNGTDINEGLKTAYTHFHWERSDVVRRIVLLTDGHGGNPLRTADELKRRGVVIDAIGVGYAPSDVDEKLLKQVASTVEGELRYRFIKDQQTLVQHYTMLANKTAIGV